MGLFHRHLQNLVYVLALVLDLQRLSVVALAVTHVTRNIHIRQKMHFDFDHAVTLAGFAASTLDVERKASRPIAAFARRRYAGEQFADGREQAGIGGGIGTRRASDRALIDVDHLVEKFQAADLGVRCGFGVAAVEMLRHGRIQRVVDQRGFAGTGYAGHAHHQSDRKIQCHTF